MRKIRSCFVIVALTVPLGVSRAEAPEPANSGDKLGQCLVLRTTGGDRLLVAKWMGSSIGSAPQLQGLVTVNPVEKAKIDTDMAALFVRLFAVDCAKEARTLLQKSNQQGIEAGGYALGKVAMDELMNDPKENEAMSAFIAHIDPQAFDKLRN